MRYLATILALLTLSGAAGAAGDVKHPEHHHWHFDGFFGAYDKAAVQRGFQVYREVCAACHSLEHLSFRNLGEKGGPYYDEEHPNPNDNAMVKAIAAEYIIQDIDDLGDPIDRPGRVADKFPNPYPNPQAARAGNGGALPPDLSVIVKARHGGADYIASLMTGYTDAPADVEVLVGTYYNPYFSGGLIAMPPQLLEGRVEYMDGTEAAPEQMALDVTEFLAWASEPKMEARKQLGFMTLIYLLILAVLLWFSYQAAWRNEH